MKRILLFIGLGMGLLLCSGCEWTSGGGVDYWNDSGASVDFSGSYKATDGSILVTAFGLTNETYTITTNIASGELLGTGDGSNTAFYGAMAYSPYPGSLTIAVSSYSFTDSAGGAGTVSLSVIPADGSTGTLNYDTKAWALTFPAPIASGTKMLANYIYLATTTNSDQGNTGNAIYSFIVYQTGNKLQIIDSNNSSYEGTIGNVVVGDTSDTATEVTEASAQFSAEGISQGYSVQIVGTLKKSTVIRVYWTGGYDKDGNEVYATETVGGFKMEATWIEASGNTANIYEEAVSF